MPSWTQKKKKKYHKNQAIRKGQNFKHKFLKKREPNSSNMFYHAKGYRKITKSAVIKPDLYTS